MKLKFLLVGVLIWGFQVSAQSLRQNQDYKLISSCFAVEENLIDECFIDGILVSIPSYRGYLNGDFIDHQPAPLSRIYREPEFISPERDEAPGVNTNVMPMTHRNTWGLNRKVITYSDIYYSPSR